MLLWDGGGDGDWHPVHSGQGTAGAPSADVPFDSFCARASRVIVRPQRWQEIGSSSLWSCVEAGIVAGSSGMRPIRIAESAREMIRESSALN